MQAAAELVESIVSLLLGMSGDTVDDDEDVDVIAVHGPDVFSVACMRRYIAGDVAGCRECIAAGFADASTEEKQQLFWRIFMYARTARAYDDAFFVWLLTHTDLRARLSSDTDFAYMCLYSSLWSDRMFRRVLYSRAQWSGVVTIDDLAPIDYVYVLIVLGSARQLVWFLDWARFHGALDAVISRETNYEHVYVALLHGKFRCAHILEQYGFPRRAPVYHFRFGTGLLPYRRVETRYGAVYVRSALLEEITHASFATEIVPHMCARYEHLYMMTDVITILPSAECMYWNLDVLFQLPYPKRIVCLAVQSLCKNTDHTMCGNVEHVMEECARVSRGMCAEMCYQLLVQRRTRRDVVRRVLRRMYARHVLRKLDAPECAICLETMCATTTHADANVNASTHMSVCVLGCGHYYHTACLDEWRVQHNACPYCRKEIINVTRL